MTEKKTMAQESSEDFVKRMCEPQRNITILKAQNEMLEEARLECIERGDVDDGIISQIEDAKQDNLRLAMSQYGATPEDVENAQYHGASIKAIKAYENRLKKKGLTDEMLHQKNLKISSVSGSSELNDESEKFKHNKRTESGVGKVEDASVPKEPKGKSEEPVKRTEENKRRERKKTEVKRTEETVDTNIEITVNPDRTIEQPKEEPVKLETKPKKTEKKEKLLVESFNLDNIPDYVQYDIIPLPSKGQCYKHKKSRVAVAYLTAADENLIASPNMYRDGKLLDVILKRKILDKDFNVDELCSGDRDAIILWLRATSYGDEFPIVATNPDTGKQYNISVNLSEFKYYDFNLESNENGNFEYITSNGDKFEFKFLTRMDEDEMKEMIIGGRAESNRVALLKNVTSIVDIAKDMEMEKEDREHLAEDIEEIIQIFGGNVPDLDDEAYSKTITEQMIIHTVAVNGNTDKEYIRNYVENMRAMDARAYRDYFTKNRPGVDFSLKVNVPESDGGGSFDTFLRLDDTVFLNF